MALIMAVVIKATIRQKVHSQWARHVTTPQELTYYSTTVLSLPRRSQIQMPGIPGLETNTVIAYLDFDASTVHVLVWRTTPSPHLTAVKHFKPKC